jgi:hypothetical protein
MCTHEIWQALVHLVAIRRWHKRDRDQQQIGHEEEPYGGLVRTEWRAPSTGLVLPTVEVEKAAGQTGVDHGFWIRSHCVCVQGV